MAALTRAQTLAYVPGGKTPRRPMFIDVLPRPRIGFETVADLARFIQTRRGKAGLQLRAQVCSLGGSDTFPIFEVNLLHPDEDQGEYIGAIAIQGMSREAFEELLREAEPAAAKASARQARHSPASVLVLA